MQEAKIRRELFRLFERSWYWPITQTDAALCPKCGSAVYPKGGRPDILVLHPISRTIVCEVKRFPLPTGDDWRATSFPFSRIEENQRKWLSMWEADGGMSYIGLGMGHQRITSKVDRRRCWLVPWPHWLAVENQLTSAGQKSLPLALKPRLRKKVALGKLTAINLLKPFELVWRNSGWAFSNEHPLHITRTPRDVPAWRKKWKGGLSLPVDLAPRKTSMKDK